jgi:putative ABC transport system permease protein
MNTLINDIRFACRMLTKRSGFTAIALITLALGIGANTIMFSVVNVLLLRPPLVKDPDQLAVCIEENTRGFAFSYSTYVDMRNNNPAFSDLMAYDPGLNFLTLVRGEAVRRVYGMFVSANYFSILGVSPAYGRAFLPEEERYGADPVVVLSHRTWQRQGGDPDIIGKYITLNGTHFRIIGVAPRRFTGTAVLGPDLWLPIGSFGLVGHLGREKPQRWTSELWNYPMDIVLVGRLKPGLTMAAAQVRLQPLISRFRENDPRTWKANSTVRINHLPRLTAEPRYGGSNDRSRLSNASLFLMGVSAIVLLIACLNLANMMVVQGTARHREIAIRMAIGSGRLRIVRQLLIESLLLAAFGGALALVLAFWGTRLLNSWIGTLKAPIDIAGALRTGLDIRVLAGTLAFCVIAAVLSGLKPALRLSRREVAADLKQSCGEVVGSSGGVRRPRGLSVVCQIALSVVLVMGAALFTRSALHTAPADSGFSLNGKLVVELDPLSAGYDVPRTQQVYESLAERLKSMPGVQAVSMSASFPLAEEGSYVSVREYMPGAPKDQRDEEQFLRDMIAHPPKEQSLLYSVGIDFFEAMGMPLLQARSFKRLDSAPNAEKVVIIDESLAHKLRPDGNALGCLVQYGLRPSSSPPARVVGIVPSLRIVTDSPFNPTQIYAPLGPESRPLFIHIRIANGKRSLQAALLQRIPAEIHKVDSHIPIVSVMTLAERHHSNPLVWLWGFGARLAAIFGLMALFLASLGIYAVKGHMVASHAHEIGIRIALGATNKNIVGMVLREGTLLTFAGLIAGLFLALAAGRLIGSLLYGISPVDPVSIVVTVVLLGAASLLAGYIPARRAAKIDPMEALRYE